jgi:hypothetical protein
LAALVERQRNNIPVIDMGVDKRPGFIEVMGPNACVVLKRNRFVIHGHLFVVLVSQCVQQMHIINQAIDRPYLNLGPSLANKVPWSELRVIGGRVRLTIW